MKNKLIAFALVLALCVSGAFMAFGCTKPTYTVTYYDGETVLTSVTVEEGATVSGEVAEATQKVGFSISWNDADGNAYDFTKPVNGNLNLYINYLPLSNVEYKVEHYFEDREGNFAIDSAMTESLTGETLSTVTASAKTVEGYVLDEGNSKNVLSGAIKGDGSLVLKVYYARAELKVSFMVGDEEFAATKTKYGKPAYETQKTVEDQNKTVTTIDKFSHWSLTKDGEAYNFSTEVTENITLYVVFTTVTREYAVTVETQSSITATDESGDPLATTVEAGTEFKFKLSSGVEAEIASVTATVNNDVTGEDEQLTLTAVNGVYTVTVTGITTVTVTANARTYDFDVAFEIDLSGYDNMWALPAYDLSGYLLKARNVETDAIVETAGTVKNGAITGSVPAGEYMVYVVKKVGDEEIAVSNELPFAVNYNTNNAEGNVVEGLLKVRPVAVNKLYQAEFDENGYVSSTKDTTFTATLAEFNPGEKDFAVTVSYDQPVVLDCYSTDQTKHESTPSFGFEFGNDNHSAGLYALGEGNARVVVDDVYDWTNGSAYDAKNLMASAGALFGFVEWPDCYRHAEVTYVKTGGWMYVSITADGKAGYKSNGAIVGPTRAIEYEDLLLYAVEISTGKVYFKHSLKTGAYETFTNKTLTDVLTNINRGTFKMMTNKNQELIDVNAHGYGFTYDEAVIASYATKFVAARDKIVKASAEERITWTDTLNGSSFIVNEDGSLQHIRTHAMNQDKAVAGVTFTPNKQTLEFQYTMTGMATNCSWPALGFYAQDPNGGRIRLVWYEAGDVVILTVSDDCWQSRLGMEDSDKLWEWYGANCVLRDAEGNPITEGTFEDNYNYNWQPNKSYNVAGEYELTVKVVMTGYKFSLYVKTSATKKIDPNAWATITENYDFYERYNTATKGFKGQADYVTSGKWKEKMINPDLECQFGISARLDMAKDGCCDTINRPVFSDISYKITDNAK